MQGLGHIYIIHVIPSVGQSCLLPAFIIIKNQKNCKKNSPGPAFTYSRTIYFSQRQLLKLNNNNKLIIIISNVQLAEAPPLVKTLLPDNGPVENRQLPSLLWETKKINYFHDIHETKTYKLFTLLVHFHLCYTFRSFSK